MHKVSKTESPENSGHDEKTKSKNYTNRREKRFPA